MTRILVVCTANICRSPVAEAALATALEGTGISVSSAGTHAEDGAAPDPVSVDFLQRELGVRIRHRARALRPGLVDDSDLVLTMTAAQRSLVAEAAPRAVRRTFTVRELALITAQLQTTEQHASLRELALRCARLRLAAAVPAPGLDVADPYRGPSAMYATSFGQIMASTRAVAAAIRRSVPTASTTGTS